ncbi:hypothetical protein L798_11369 [Zootermopsis nevadensis]|uniref:Uncharacterized protein n=1 Tax=Zootermopsis nevadensis TaxID=136037 RepID=A0A067RL97_ZOONE|nr:hypothetical protein L798_11369 [Zootermopsis nevadensis]
MDSDTCSCCGDCEFCVDQEESDEDGPRTLLNTTSSLRPASPANIVLVPVIFLQ